jgi:hypothetical protein
MLNTDVFAGSYYRVTSFGGIHIEGRGDIAHITLIDHDDRETKVAMEAFTLAELQQAEIYKNVNATHQIDLLFHFWHTKITSQYLIVYANDQQLALVFKSLGNIKDNFAKLLEAGFYQFDYFRELLFVHYLKKEAMTMTSLRTLPGFTEAKCKLMVDDVLHLEKLLALGITIVELAQMEQEELIARLATVRTSRSSLAGLFGPWSSPPDSDNSVEEDESDEPGLMGICGIL